MLSKICYGLGFTSIGLSILSYGSYGIDITYIGLLGFHRSFWWDNTLIGKIDAKQQTIKPKQRKRLARQRSQRRS